MPIRWSRFQYGWCLQASTIRVALLWTPSSSLECFCNFGDHITCAYSRWGLINVMYNWRKRSGVRWKKLLLIKPTIEFAFFTGLNMCSSKDRSLSKITPRSFSLKTWSSTLFPSLYEWACLMLSNLPSVSTWHFPGWNRRIHLVVHLSKASTLLCRSSESCLLFIGVLYRQRIDKESSPQLLADH